MREERKQYKLLVSSDAKQDLENIYYYIADSLLAEAAADSLIDEIENTIQKLKQFPKLYQVVDNELLKIKGYRKIIIKNFVILYFVDENAGEVIIMRAFYARSNYKKEI